MSFARLKTGRAALAVLFAGIALLAGALAGAQTVPGLISFQGRLTDASNNPLSGSHAFVFRVYDAQTGGSVLWTESQPAVTVSNGIFAVHLGSITPITASVLGAATAYLEVTADGVLLTPRERLVSAAYAFNAQLLEGRSYASFVSTAAVSQTIAGDKTFTAAVTVGAPTLPGHAATKAYVDASASGGVLDSTNTWSGQNTFLNMVWISSHLALSGRLNPSSDLQIGGAGFGVTFASAVTAGHFYGSGAGLTGIVATNVTAAGVQAGELGGSVIASSIAVNAINDASQLAAGLSIPDSRLAAIATAGKVADTALSANVGLLTGAQAFTGAKTFSAPAGVAVSYGVAAGSASISGGITASSATFTQTGADYSLRTSSGISVQAGGVTAAYFAGSGAALTGIVATNVTAAGVQAGELGGSVIASSIAVNAINDASQLAAGLSIPDSRLAAIATAGKVADTALSANVGLLTGAQAFTGAKTFSAPAGVAVTYGVAAGSASISGGITASSATFTQTGADYSLRTSSGISVQAGGVTAAYFAGSGAALTGIVATNVTAAGVQAGELGGSVIASSIAVNAINDASQLAAGLSIPDSRLAAIATAGKVEDTALSANVGLLTGAQAFTGAKTFSAPAGVAVSYGVAAGSASISGGITASSATFTQTGADYSLRTSSGISVQAGGVTAAYFAGSGAALTGIVATNVTAAGVQAGELGGSVIASSIAVNAINDASQLAAGLSIPDSRLAAIATAGKVADTALSANVGLLSGAQAFTGAKTFSAPAGVAVSYGVAAGSASISGGITASSATFTQTGADYSLRTSSGISVQAGGVTAAYFAGSGAALTGIVATNVTAAGVQAGELGGSVIASSIAVNAINDASQLAAGLSIPDSRLAAIATAGKVADTALSANVGLLTGAQAFTGAKTFSAPAGVAVNYGVAAGSASISGGITASSATFTQTGADYSLRTSSGISVQAGGVTAAYFAGSGAALTGIVATNVTAAGVQAGELGANVIASSIAVNAINDASQLAAGLSIPDSRLAAIATAGKVEDTALSANVGLLTGAQAFTGAKTFSAPAGVAVSYGVAAGSASISGGITASSATFTQTGADYSLRTSSGISVQAGGVTAAYFAGSGAALTGIVATNVTAAGVQAGELGGSVIASSIAVNAINDASQLAAGLSIPDSRLAAIATAGKVADTALSANVGLLSGAQAFTGAKTFSAPAGVAVSYGVAAGSASISGGITASSATFTQTGADYSLRTSSGISVQAGGVTAAYFAGSGAALTGIVATNVTAAGVQAGELGGSVIASSIAVNAINDASQLAAGLSIPDSRLAAIATAGKVADTALSANVGLLSGAQAFTGAKTFSAPAGVAVSYGVAAGSASISGGITASSATFTQTGADYSLRTSSGISVQAGGVTAAYFAGSGAALTGIVATNVTAAGVQAGELGGSVIASSIAVNAINDASQLAAGLSIPDSRLAAIATAGKVADTALSANVGLLSGAQAFTGAKTFSAPAGVAVTYGVAAGSASISGGITASSATFTQTGADYSLRTSSGISVQAGGVTAAYFAGSGAALTGIVATNVTAAGVQAGALGGSVIASSIAVNAINDASQLAAGLSIPDSRLAAIATAGKVADTALSANVGLLTGAQAFTGAKTFSAPAGVAVTYGVAAGSASISGGITASSATFTQTGADYSLRTSSGISVQAGGVTAAYFAGSGAALTGVVATNVTAAGVQAGELGANVIASSIAVNAINDASQLAAGLSIPDSRLAAIATAGKVADTALSANVGLLSGAQAFTGAKTFSAPAGVAVSYGVAAGSASISGGITASSATFTQTGADYSLRTSSGISVQAGGVTAAYFAGSGAALTGVVATNVTAAGVQAGELGGSVIASSIAVNAINDASQLAAGLSIPDSRLAAIATAGKVEDTALSANVGLLTGAQAFTGAKTFSAPAGVAVSYGVAAGSASISGGITASSATFTQTGADYSLRTSSGISVQAGGVTAAYFAGNGAALTNVSATNVTAAGVQAGELGANVIASSIAVNAINDASQLAAGLSIPDSRLAAIATAGKVADTALSANVGLLSGAQAFTGAKTFSAPAGVAVTYGVAAGSASISGGITASSATFTQTGADYSLRTSSGISVQAGGVTAAYFAGSGAALTGVVATNVTAAGVQAGELGGSVIASSIAVNAINDASQLAAGLSIPDSRLAAIATAGKVADTALSANVGLLTGAQAFTGAKTFSAPAGVAVNYGVAAGSASISGGITASSATFTQTGADYSLRTSSGISVQAGGVTAAYFAGSGAALTNVSATNVAAAGVQAGELGANVIASSIAVNAINDASQLAAGLSIPDSRLAAIATAGKVEDTALSANVGLLTGAQAFTGAKTFSAPAGVAVSYGVAAGSASISGGITASSATFTQTGADYSLRTSSGISVQAGGVTAAYFAGSGAALTGVVATNVTAAGVQAGELGGSVIASSIAVNAINDASQLAAGLSIPDSRLAAIATAGKVEDTALSANVGLLTGAQAFTGAKTFSAPAGVAVSYGVAAGSASISGGITASSATFTQTGADYSLRTSSGISVQAGGVTAAYFAGSGAALTGIVATNVTAAGVQAGELGGSVIASSIAVNAINDASQLAAGLSIPDSRLAAIATAGKVADTALSANVGLLTGAQAFTGAKTFSAPAGVAVTYGVAAGSASISGSLTASTGSFSGQDAAGYSLTLSSGLSVGGTITAGAYAFDVTRATAATTTSLPHTINCPAGKRAMSGGCNCTGTNFSAMSSVPSPNTADSAFPTGWTCSAAGTLPSCAAYVICARISN